MNFHRIAMRSAMAAGCLWLAGCAQDTPKSVLQNSNEYATRVFVPSTLSGSVRDALAKPENKPLTFNKITFSRKTTMTYNGTPVEMSGDVTYENVGNGLVREVDIDYQNGIEQARDFTLNYRGVVWLYSQRVLPTYTKMPFTRNVSSVSQFDLSFDQPTVSYNYKISSPDPRVRTTDRTGSCNLTKTYRASQVATGATGDAKEFDCKFYNENGVADSVSTYVYLNAYGVALLSSVNKANLVIHWKLSNFKVE